jgi:hypothetical protein
MGVAVGVSAALEGEEACGHPERDSVGRQAVTAGIGPMIPQLVWKERRTVLLDVYIVLCAYGVKRHTLNPSWDGPLLVAEACGVRGVRGGPSPHGPPVRGCIEAPPAPVLVRLASASLETPIPRARTRGAGRTSRPDVSVRSRALQYL